jgi:hypothetical protein
MLSFAARHADIIGVNRSLPTSEVKDSSVFDGVAARIDDKFTLIRTAAGDRYDDLVFHGNLRDVRVTDDRLGFAETVTARTGLDLEDALFSPFMLAGTVTEMVGQLIRQRGRWGYTYYTVPQASAREFAPVIATLATY